ncbi:MAG: transaldolase [Burkholderiales bacterium]|nr:transaldolase [Burkholderiales bacterium]
MNPLRELEAHGQSPWLDFIERSLVTGGGLARLIAEDGIKGVTSNPSIFEKAITGGGEYRDAIVDLRGRGLSPRQICETLAIEDVRATADVLRPVYDATARRDGYVSLEVSPHLARDTGGTIEEARRLWRAVARPNLMIKVPGTPEGMPAIETLIAEGLNVNVTLLFSLDSYRAAARAHLAGLERGRGAGADIAGVAGVASFFVSRIDTAVDGWLDRLVAAAPPGDRARLAALRGRAAIANARLAYAIYRECARTPRWQALAGAGAMPQRLLWASTSTKNPAYRDVVYVEELIGPDTVNTLPAATVEAFRDHGVARPTLPGDVPAAQALMRDLAAAGMAFGHITDGLLADGVRLFAHSFDSLLAAVERADPAG